jgi:hypothetical protein
LKKDKNDGITMASSGDLVGRTSNKCIYDTGFKSSTTTTGTGDGWRKKGKTMVMPANG